jgi:hypothetical protein
MSREKSVKELLTNMIQELILVLNEAVFNIFIFYPADYFFFRSIEPKFQLDIRKYLVKGIE